MAIVLLCVVVGGDVLHKRFARGGSPPSSPNGQRSAAPQVYTVGETFESTPDFKLRSDRSSLLFVVRDGCKYCDLSMPFYEQVAKEARSKKFPIELVGVCLNPLEVCQSYFGAAQVPIDRFVSRPPRSLKISGTPTLLLVNQLGKVASIWVGLLSDSGQREVFDAISPPNRYR